MLICLVIDWCMRESAECIASTWLHTKFSCMNKSQGLTIDDLENMYGLINVQCACTEAISYVIQLVSGKFKLSLNVQVVMRFFFNVNDIYACRLENILDL